MAAINPKVIVDMLKPVQPALRKAFVEGIKFAEPIFRREGGKEVLKKFSGPAGRALRNGNNEVMKVYKAEKKRLKI